MVSKVMAECVTPVDCSGKIGLKHAATRMKKMLERDSPFRCSTMTTITAKSVTRMFNRPFKSVNDMAFNTIFNTKAKPRYRQIVPFFFDTSCSRGDILVRV